MTAPTSTPAAVPAGPARVMATITGDGRLRPDSHAVPRRWRRLDHGHVIATAVVWPCTTVTTATATTVTTYPGLADWRRTVHGQPWTARDIPATPPYLHAIVHPHSHHHLADAVIGWAVSWRPGPRPPVVTWHPTPIPHTRVWTQPLPAVVSALRQQHAAPTLRTIDMAMPDGRMIIGHLQPPPPRGAPAWDAPQA